MVLSNSLIRQASQPEGWKARWRGPDLAAPETVAGELGVSSPVAASKRYWAIQSDPRHGTNR